MAFHGDFTPEEDAQIVKMREQGFAWQQIADALGRGKSSCQKRLTIIMKHSAGIKPRGRPWTAEEDALLFELRKQGLQWPQIAPHVGHTAPACSSREKWLKRRHLCEEGAPEVERHVSEARDIPARSLPKTFWRKCHDCGKMTPFYRCEKCRDKWKLKHHVETDEENQGGFDG